MVLGGKAPSSAPRRGVGAGMKGASDGSGNDSDSTVDAKTSAAPVANPVTAPIIDLSATSLDDDPFLDSLEVAERQQKIAPSRKSKNRSSSSNSIVDRKKRKTVGVSSRSSSSSSGGDSSGSGSAGEATGRRHPTARPLTSISALFGGGGGGNRANRAGGSNAAPPRPRAGTKRPRANPAAGQSRMVPPLPPPVATGTVAPVGRASKPTQQSRWVGRPAANGICGGGSGGGRGAQEAAAAGGGGGGADAGVVEDQLWPEKHRPRDVSGLAVHSKKVDEVRHWMTQALAARPGSEGACRLLALVGPPGSAKSTMVRLLAQDMDVELAEWQDTSGQGGPAYRPFSDGPALGGDRPRHELGSSYQSAIDSFEEFMKRSSYRALPILAVKSKKHGTGSGGATSSSSGRAAGVSGSGSGGGGGSGGGKRRRVVLIEELPEVYGEEKKARLRNLMAECARSSPSPVIICWSQASESSSYQSRLEQVLSRETLRIPGVQITTCNPINATLLRQHLKGVLALEGVSDPKGTLVQSAITTCAGDIRHALLNLQMSVGGSRNAGLRASAFGKKSNGGGGGSQSKRGGTSRKKRDAGNVGGGSSKTGTTAAPGAGARDTFLTQFHALGKLLYAKRLPPPDSADAVTAFGKAGPPGTAAAGSGGAGGEESLRRGQLAFVPEEVLSQGGMELDWALAFLQYHCVDFFTDESDLSQGLGYFSDADLFASRMFDSSRGYDGGGEQAVFPQRYAESIASRATAATNRHPAKSRMRAFGAPKSFEMRRSRIEAAAVLSRFVGDAWDASGGDEGALWASSRHLKEAVDTDLLPTARLITGEWEAEAALRSLLHRFMQDREQQQRSPRSSAPAREELTDGSIPSLGDAAAPTLPAQRGWGGGSGGGGKGERRGNYAGELFGGEASSGVTAAAVSCAEGVEGQQAEEEDEIGEF